MDDGRVVYWQAACYSSKTGDLTVSLTVWRDRKLAFSEKYSFSERVTPMDAAVFVERAVRIIEMSPILFPDGEDAMHDDVAALVR